MTRNRTLIGALITLPAGLSAQLLVDFNSNQSGGGAPVVGDPADLTSANHNEPGYESYHARHEIAGDFVAATYNPIFGLTGAATVTMTPSWPNTTADTVKQLIGRSDGQSNSWTGNNVNLLRDWIGCDARTNNGAWDGVTGTPTYLELKFEGLPPANYEMTSFHHDVEHMNSDFTIEVSTNGGATFETPITGRITNSLSGGTPAENEVLAGTPPNEAGGDPADLSSTQVFAFTAGAQDVILRFTPLPPGDTAPVHQMFFTLNGFHLDQTLSLDDTDGDDLPDAWEDEHFGNNDGTATPAELALQSGSDNADGDGLNNEGEYLNGTDPNDEDSDDDNLLDDEEITNLTDPNNPDSDGDSLLDGDEVNNHLTDPNEQDSDGDLFFDQNEVETAPPGPGTANDPNSFPISSAGLLVDFTSNTINGQTGTFHDQGRQPYVADHEVDSDVDRSESFNVPAFGGANVTLTVDFPDTTLNTAKQLIGRASAANYDGDDADLARDWIGVDTREAQGGNGTENPSSIRFTLSGVPAGSYLYSSFHHDIAGQVGDFDIRLTDANNSDVAYDSRTMTASTSGSNPGAGQTLHVLPSTFNAVISSNGIDPIVFTYQGTETNNVLTSFVGINGFDLVTTVDTDGDGLTDDYEIANGLDHTVADSGDDEDMDDLSNLEEFQLGTQPDEEDTDSDGANDGAEIAAGSNPFVQDTDGDGLLDGPELAIGADPTSTDSDGDGFLDGTDPDPVDSSNPATADLLVAYWPLDGTPDDFTTPDLGPNGYDLSLTNMTSANFVTDEGRFAAQFDNITQTMLGRVHSPGDLLPITQHEIYTISMWVKVNGTGQNDLRIFSEGSSTNTTPLFNLGTRNNGADGVLDSYIRPAGGPAHEYTDGMPLDGIWRHIAVTGNDHTDTLQVYIDGVLDTSNITFRSLVGTEVNTTSIGGILRADPSHWVTGLVDDVALWSKILSPTEISDLAAGGSPIDTGGLPRFRITDITYDPTSRATSITWNTLPGRTYSLFMTDDLTDLFKGGDIDDSISDGGLSDSNPADGVITYEFNNPVPLDPKRFFTVHEN